MTAVIAPPLNFTSRIAFSTLSNKKIRDPDSWHDIRLSCNTKITFIRWYVLTPISDHLIFFFKFELFMPFCSQMTSPGSTHWEISWSSASALRGGLVIITFWLWTFWYMTLHSIATKSEALSATTDFMPESFTPDLHRLGPGNDIDNYTCYAQSLYPIWTFCIRTF